MRSPVDVDIVIINGDVDAVNMPVVPAIAGTAGILGAA
jgi:hypothetical protein